VRARIFSLDVLDQRSVRQAVEKILSAFDRIDILVNNAGVNIRKPGPDLTEADWDLISGH
jgi:NADP-dependent 3-hydroxy acid dehydrogenase YdfG